MEFAPHTGGLLPRPELPVWSLRTWALVFCFIFAAPAVLTVAATWWLTPGRAAPALVASCLVAAGSACFGALLLAHLLARAIGNVGGPQDAAEPQLRCVREIADIARRCRESADALRRLGAHRLNAEEAERRRLARALHDEVGQELALLQIWLRALQKEGLASPDGRRMLRESEGLAGTLMEQVRSMALDLRPAQLDDLGLGPALRALARRVGRQAGISVTLLALPDDVPRFPDALETALFRVAQAAVTNTVRHARASTLWLTLDVQHEAVALKVQDDGTGFDPDALLSDATPGGMGILVMQERVHALGGTMSIESAPGAGTLVRARIPRVNPPGGR